MAVGCLAERYGSQLAEALPEADAVLGFDAYPDIADRVRALLDGEPQPAHEPRDRRLLLPLTPVDRAGTDVSVPGHAHRPAEPDLPAGVGPASGPPVVRRRLGGGPVAPVKLASGCDRRCSFCAIPSFRGSFVSRPADEVLADARWLAGEGVRELFCVSENTTSYGKDLGDLRLLEGLLPQLAAVDGIERVRVSYLQPAETRPGLLDVMTGTPGVVPYFDLSFQHASPSVLRRMRRFGDSERFLGLLGDVRDREPLAGVRSNVIVGFPGETDHDVQVLCDFLAAARLDVVGVFGYSDEDGTEAASLPDKVDQAEVRARADHVGRLVEELTAQRAEDRVGELVEVLVEVDDGDSSAGAAAVEGRAAHQGPDVDGTTTVLGPPADVRVGELLTRRGRGRRGGRPGRALPGRPSMSHDDAGFRVRPPTQTERAAPPSNWNIANALTLLRLLLVPVFGWLLIAGDDSDSDAMRWAALAVFVIASITDQVDGYLARKHGLVTAVGAVADPIADKLLTGVAFVLLSYLGELPWWATIVILAREWGVTLLRFWVIRYGVISASPGGKLKTTLQIAVLIGYLVPLPDALDDALNPVFDWVLYTVLVATVLITLVTGIDYVVRASRCGATGRTTQ